MIVEAVRKYLDTSGESMRAVALRAEVHYGRFTQWLGGGGGTARGVGLSLDSVEKVLQECNLEVKPIAPRRRKKKAARAVK